jgi:hypothetical protein
MRHSKYTTYKLVQCGTNYAYGSWCKRLLGLLNVPQTELQSQLSTIAMASPVLRGGCRGPQ